MHLSRAAASEIEHAACMWYPRALHTVDAHSGSVRDITCFNTIHTLCLRKNTITAALCSSIVRPNAWRRFGASPHGPF